MKLCWKIKVIYFNLFPLVVRVNQSDTPPTHQHTPARPRGRSVCVFCNYFEVAHYLANYVNCARTGDHKIWHTSLARTEIIIYYLIWRWRRARETATERWWEAEVGVAAWSANFKVINFRKCQSYHTKRCAEVSWPVARATTGAGAVSLPGLRWL